VGFIVTIFSAASTLLDLSISPQCPQVEGIEPFSAALAQDGLAECDQPEKIPLKYSVIAGN